MTSDSARTKGRGYRGPSEVADGAPRRRQQIVPALPAVIGFGWGEQLLHRVPELGLQHPALHRMRLPDLSSDPPLQLPDRQIKAVLWDLHLPRPAPQRINCFVLS
jgi:hypothetical protein